MRQNGRILRNLRTKQLTSRGGEVLQPKRLLAVCFLVVECPVRSNRPSILGLQPSCGITPRTTLLPKVSDETGADEPAELQAVARCRSLQRRACAARLSPLSWFPYSQHVERSSFFRRTPQPQHPQCCYAGSQKPPKAQ